MLVNHMPGLYMHRSCVRNNGTDYRALVTFGDRDEVIQFQYAPRQDVGYITQETPDDFADDSTAYAQDSARDFILLLRKQYQLTLEADRKNLERMQAELNELETVYPD